MFKHKKTIAILGVDGSGKSTAVENLSTIYGDKCSITYMGYTRFEDPRIELLRKKRHTNPITTWLTYRCFWHRYFKALKQGDFAIFDRYVHEIFINANKSLYSRINIILYKYLFPKPQKMVYLYCSSDESLRRKNDIPNPDTFIAMKKRFDNYFLNRKGVLCLDSEQLSPQEITMKISELIDQSFYK